MAHQLPSWRSQDRCASFLRSFFRLPVPHAGGSSTKVRFCRSQYLCSFIFSTTRATSDKLDRCQRRIALEGVNWAGSSIRGVHPVPELANAVKATRQIREVRRRFIRRLPDASRGRVIMSGSWIYVKNSLSVFESVKVRRFCGASQILTGHSDERTSEVRKTR